jgi:hypothetical protein
MGKATSKAKMEIEEKCVCRMGSGRELTFILVVDSADGELVGQVTSGVNGAAWCHGHWEGGSCMQLQMAIDRLICFGFEDSCLKGCDTMLLG